VKDHADRFGELRSALQRAPDPHTWGAICDLLDQWPDDASLTEIALPYCEAHMRGWQDAWRVAPKRWVRRLIAGEPIVALSLARRLRVHTPLLDKERVSMITRHPALATITALDVSSTQLDEGAYDLLATLTQHNALTSLDLSNNPDALRTLGHWLATKPEGPPLKHLALADIVERDHSQRNANYLLWETTLLQLARSPLARHLTSLDISGNSYAPPDALDALAHSATSLDTLHLSPRHMGETLFMRLVQPVWSSRLRHLFIHDTYAVSTNLHTLREAYMMLSSLLSLGLRGCQLSDDQLSTLLAPLQHDQPWRLTSLHLARNHITDAGVEHLLELPWLPQLQHIDLSSNHITDAAALALVTSPNLHPHATIKLHGNDLDELTHAAIAAAAALRSDLASTGDLLWRAAAIDPEDPWWLA
jgi:hypothetical protein